VPESPRFFVGLVRMEYFWWKWVGTTLIPELELRAVPILQIADD